MRYDFSPTLNDELLGIPVVYDCDCQVVISFELSDGAPEYSIDGVYLDGKNLFDGGPIAKAMAAEIAAMAERNLEQGGHLLADVHEAEGVVYRGLGGNDPDGHLARVL